MTNTIQCRKEENGKYLVQTQSQTKDRGIKVPEVHGSEERYRSKLKTRMASKKDLRNQ